MFHSLVSSFFLELNEEAKNNSQLSLCAMQINNHRSSHRKEYTNSVITMKIMPVSYITNRRRIRFWMPLPTRQRALYVLGVIGCFHLLIQTIARVYLYFNPFSPYVAAVNVLSTYCYISNNEQRKYDEESYQKVIKSAQYEFESYATLYSSNVCYSANQDPSRLKEPNLFSCFILIILIRIHTY